MEIQDLEQRGNTLQGRFLISRGINQSCTTIHESPEYIINGSGLIQVKVIAAIESAMHVAFVNFILIKFTKVQEEDELIHVIKFSSRELGILGKKFTSDDGTFHLIHEVKITKFSFDFHIQMDILPTVSSFSILHEDTDLTDFELCGEDGHVRVHRAVLAAASPVLKRMYGGTWKETTEGKVDVPNTSKLTLQHLKDYVYLHKLPDIGLEHLLLLASCYMMADLEQRCVKKLLENLTAENTCSLLEFAVIHKLTNLMLAILESVQRGYVKVSDMRRFFK